MLNELVSADVFDSDYVYFYEAFQTGALNDDETDLILHLLDLGERADVLDACCGTGRIANRLAVRGHRVDALDHNLQFCDLGTNEARRMGVKVNYRCEDVRQFEETAAFDAVISWFSSFGYWDDRTNVDVLRRFRRCLRPGGQLLLDLPNPSLVLRQLGPDGAAVRRVRQVGEHDVMDDELSVDLERSLLQVQRHITRDGKERDVRWACRLYSPSELSVMLSRTGFGTVAMLGDEGQPLHADSSRQIVLATAI